MSRRGELQLTMSRDDVLDDITLCWLTNTGVLFARFYWASISTSLPPLMHRFPRCRERFFARELSGAAKLDRAHLSQLLYSAITIPPG